MTGEAFAEALFRTWLRSRLGDKDGFPSWEDLPADMRATWRMVSSVALALRDSVDEQKQL